MAKKILIVDDEKDVLTVLQTRLSSAGYEVIKANNGNDAIAAAKSESPDLIVLDIMMPGMDGSQTSQVLKNDPQTKKIPIIFLTCLVTKEEEAKEIPSIEGECFLAKPYDSNELIRKIKKHLS